MICTERCPDCPSRNLPADAKPKTIVSGDWDGDGHDPHILFVGEAPGKEENNRHRVFIGTTGKEFNETYLPQACLSRAYVSMTNTVKCHWADSSDAPPDKLVKSCSEFHLRRELVMHQPDMVVLMGGTANSLLGIDVEVEHGFYRTAELLGWRGTVYSTFHPALGLHKSNKMAALLDDFRRLRLLLQHKLIQPKDELYRQYLRLTEPEEVENTLKGRYWDPIGVDTESKKSWRGYKSTIKYDPWCATFAVEPGMAFMVRVENTAAMVEFFRHLRKFRRVIFHNAPYDFGILTRIISAVQMPQLMMEWKNVFDTMEMAYEDGRTPKGLKALARRLLGVNMQSFDETVVPASREVALEYLAKALIMEWPKPIQEPTGLLVERKCTDCGGKGYMTVGKGKAKKVYECDCVEGKVIVPAMTRKQGMNEKLNRLATDLKGKPGLDVWERWDGWGLDVQPLIDKIGPIPIPSIEYTDEDEAIAYACGDAHETLRLFPIMQKRLNEMRRYIQ